MIAEQYFRNYLIDFSKNVKPLWNYEAGVVLLGAQYMYEVTNDIFYRDKIIEFMDHHIEYDGTIRYLDLNERNLDKINSGKILFFLYRQTGEKRYKVALDTLMNLLNKHPRTSTGNFWHKQIYPNQIWLDGLYMALPFYMEYDNMFNGRKNYNDIYQQMANVHKLMYSKDEKLYYHAYDETRQMAWADKTTGLSHNFWLRSIGWHLMALIDLYDLSSEEVFEQHKQYAIWFKEALKGILQYQDPKSKLFYQLIALPEVTGNYLETSGSAMISYCILKGCRLGVLQEEKYRKTGEDILRALFNQKMVKISGQWHLKDICMVAGLGPKNERDGSVEYYLSEPIVSDDLKGVGAVMMAYSEFLKLRAADI